MTTELYMALLHERKKAQENALAQTLWELYKLSGGPDPYTSLGCVRCDGGYVIIQSHAGAMRIREAL